MFVLYEMTRDVRIEPVNLDLNRYEAIRDELNRRLSNRVMLDKGLCMALFDVLSIGPAMIYPGDGGVHSQVNFRYVVFRPFQDEIIIGKIKNCTPEGVHVTLGFYDDILIPREGLQYPSKFDEREQIWIWEYTTEDDDEVHEMYMDKGESIRFRVVGEKFTDTTPTHIGPTNPQAGPSSGDIGQAPRIPYHITGSINEPGLGLLTWWN